MKVSKVTNIGLVRKTNEDSLIAEEELGLFGVADGMGGHQAGEVASFLAVQALADSLRNNLSVSEVDLSGLLVSAVKEANQQVYEQAQKQNSFRGMGTTITVGLFRDKMLQIAHVGDSRAYLFRNGSLTRLTADHSLVYELAQSGGISEEEAFMHPQRNVLTRALGTEVDVTVDSSATSLLPGDKILFCTDGLCGLVRDKEIEQHLLEPELNQAVDNLLAAALQQGGMDNISIILVEIN